MARPHAWDGDRCPPGGRCRPSVDQVCGGTAGPPSRWIRLGAVLGSDVRGVQPSRGGSAWFKSLLAVVALAALLVPLPAGAAVIPILDLYGTGAATQTSLVATGTTDPHYRVVAFVSATNTGTQAGYPDYPPQSIDFLGAARAYRISDWTPNVTSGDRWSQWVAPPGCFTTTGTPFSPDGQMVIGPVGRYVYETTFTLPAALTDLTRVAIAGTFAADNLGLAVSLNGNDFDPAQFGGTSFSYDSSTPLASYFVGGVNTLQFRARNLFNTPEENDFYNPTGIQVTITSAFYVTVPEIDPSSWPAALALVVAALGWAEHRRRG